MSKKRKTDEQGNRNLSEVQVSELKKFIIDEVKKNKGHKWDRRISLAAFIISFAHLVWQVLLKQTEEDTIYLHNANAYRPEVIVLNDSTLLEEEPIIKEFFSNFDKIKYKEEIQRAIDANGGEPTPLPNPLWYFTPDIRIKIAAQITATNKTTTKADILLVGMVSAGSDTSVKLLVDRLFDGTLFRQADSPHVYENPIILGLNERKTFSFNITPNFNNDTCVFHYLIVYKNDLGCIYGSYYIIKYNFKVAYPLTRPISIVSNEIAITIDDITTYTKDLDVSYSIMDKPYYYPIVFTNSQAVRIMELLNEY